MYNCIAAVKCTESRFRQYAKDPMQLTNLVSFLRDYGPLIDAWDIKNLQILHREKKSFEHSSDLMLLHRRKRRSIVES